MGMGLLPSFITIAIFLWVRRPFCVTRWLTPVASTALILLKVAALFLSSFGVIPRGYYKPLNYGCGALK